MSFREGQRIKHYVLESPLASGGMGVVWKARDSANQQVAIKTIVEDLVDDRDFQVRFLDEIRRHSRLVHPNIVNIIEVFSFQSQFCMVMRLVPGVSLAALLDHCPEHRLHHEMAVPIVQDVLSALDYAHRQGIVHRDVKPSNILLDHGMRAYLADFGIALGIGEHRRTRTGRLVGTPEYMSPEQIRTPKQIDHRTDVYSTGCVFYEMLTGRPPFMPSPDARGDSDFVVRSLHIDQLPVPPRQRVSSIPEDLSDLIMYALEKNPDGRIPGCKEFSRLLTEASNRRNPSMGRWRKLIGVLRVAFRQRQSNPGSSQRHPVD